MANQVLSRPMFQQSAGGANQVAPTMGLGAITTPDQNAQAMKNMFRPQIPVARPTQSFPVPGAFRRGGEVINGVAHFADGNEVVVPSPAQEVPAYAREGYDPTSAEAAQRYLSGTQAERSRLRRESADTTSPVPALLRPIPDAEAQAEGRRRMEEMNKGFSGQRALIENADKGYQQRAAAEGYGSAATALRNTAQDTAAASPQAVAGMRMMEEGRLRNDQGMVRQGAALIEASSEQAYNTSGATPRGEPLRRAGEEVIATPATTGIASLSPSDTTIKSMQEAYSNANPAGLPSPAMGGTPLASTAVPPPALPPLDNGQELQLQSIKARREQSEKDREQNKYMALLSAGLGMMSGTNKNAFANIGAGGQQGIATFAGLEKARREDEATRRHEDILKAQMDQQMQITKMHLAQDPEQVRVYKALGGGDLVKGFQLVSSDKILEAAVKLSADFTADPAKRANAVNFINQRIQESSGARPGAAGGPPPGSTVRSATDFVAAGK